MSRLRENKKSALRGASDWVFPAPTRTSAEQELTGRSRFDCSDRAIQQLRFSFRRVLGPLGSAGAQTPGDGRCRGGEQEQAVTRACCSETLEDPDGGDDPVVPAAISTRTCSSPSTASVTDR